MVILAQFGITFVFHLIYSFVIYQIIVFTVNINESLPNSIVYILLGIALAIRIAFEQIIVIKSSITLEKYIYPIAFTNDIHKAFFWLLIFTASYIATALIVNNALTAHAPFYIRIIVFTALYVPQLQYCTRIKLARNGK